MLDGEDKAGEEVVDLKAVEVDENAPVEVEIGADGAGTVIETVEKKGGEEGDGDPKPRRKSRIDRRIGQLTARATEAETTNQRLQREVEELRAGRVKDAERIRVTDESALANHEAHVKSQVQASKQALTEAHAAGDAAKIAEATIEAGKWSAKAARVEEYRAAHPAPKEGDEPKPKTETKTEETQPQRQQPSREFMDFATENNWFEPGTKDSPNPDFDLEMHQYAVRFGGILDGRYQRNGKTDQIGSAAYFKEIVKAVEAEFPDAFGDDGELEPKTRAKAPPMKQDGDHIPQRSQQQPAGGNGNGSGKGERIKLLPEEAALARSNLESGIYGPVNPATNKPWTVQEAYVRMARAIQKDRQQQAAAGGQRR